LNWDHRSSYIATA